MKSLIVEDDREISAMIREGLDDAGYFTVVCRDGERAFRLARSGTFSVIILDLMLPSMDGITFCRQLRAARINTPVLMLTAMDKVSDRVTGLESGADDYLVKPFDFLELLARIRALLRREHTLKQSKVYVDDLVIDTTRKTVERAGREIVLTGREYNVLELLATHVGQVFSRDTLSERIWLEERSGSNVVDVTIKNIRRKIDESSPPRLIHAVHGLGYVLRVDQTA